jgi:hypothetical protein
VQWPADAAAAEGADAAAAGMPSGISIMAASTSTRRKAAIIAGSLNARTLTHNDRR